MREYMMVHALRTREMKNYFNKTHDNVYQFRKDRKHHWLQNLCLRILKKLDARYIEQMTDIKCDTVRINTGDFLKNLLEQRREIEREFNRRPTRVLIGSEDFDEVMNTKTMRNMLQFPTTYKFNVDDGYGRVVGQVMDLNVEVIPWMRGVIVL